MSEKLIVHFFKWALTNSSLAFIFPESKYNLFLVFLNLPDTRSLKIKYHLHNGFVVCLS